MLSLNNWIAHEIGEQAPNMIVLMTVQPVSAVADYFMSGTEQVADKDGSAYQDYIQNIHGVTPITPSLDPITRKVQSSDMTVTLIDDGSIRAFLAYGTSNIYFGAAITLEWASADNLAVRAPLWKGLVSDIVPVGGFIEIRCQDAIAIATNLIHLGTWWGNHPLELAETLIRAVAQVPATMFNSTTFDPAVDTDVGHFCVGNLLGWVGANSLANAQDNTTTRDVRKLLNDLSFLLYAAIFVAEDGRITYKRFGASTSVDRTWTDKDIIEIHQSSAWDGMINQVSFRVGRTGRDFEESAGVEELYQINDTASQIRYRPLGGTEYIKSRTFSVPLLCGRIRITNAHSPTTTVGIDIQSGNMGGMTGARMSNLFRGTVPIGAWAGLNGGAWAQPAEATISAARPLYLKMSKEILKAEGLTFALGSIASFKALLYNEQGNASTKEEYLPTFATLTGVTRGPGAVAYHQDHWYNTGAWDVTPAHNIGRRILDRAANGMPILRVTTSIAEMAVQLGDLVAIESREPLWFEFDGFDASNILTWEVIGKEIDPLAFPPLARWTLAFAGVASDPWTKTIVDDPLDPESPGQQWALFAYWYQEASGNTLIASTWVKTAFDRGDPDEPIGWEIDTADEYRVHIDGVYTVTGSITLGGVNAEHFLQCAIYLNSLVRRLGSPVYQAGAAGSKDEIQATVEMPSIFLERGDIVEMRAYHDDTATRTIFEGKQRTYLTLRLE